MFFIYERDNFLSNDISTFLEKPAKGVTYP